ncbi:MAG TPA: hypothetical protein VNJ71_10665 [Gemmatimonadales bacterium]|nr:hypothetical protein [Gemmatimonadales bacterium]
MTPPIATAPRDPGLPALARALDPDAAHRMLETYAAAPLGARRLLLHGLRLVRHKPHRRAVVEYRLKVERGDRCDSVTVLAKIRAKGADRATFRLAHELRALGLTERSSDGIAVPEPVALVPEADLWLQRRVPGVPVEVLIRTPEATRAAQRAAEALAALHRSGARPARRHTLQDELAILAGWLDVAAAERPRLRRRIERVGARCREVAAAAGPGRAACLHRDWYHDHVLIRGRLAWILDLDCVAEGEPALDVGNFVAHLLELGLREAGDPDRFAGAAQAFVARALALDPGLSRDAVEAATTLALARHLGLSVRLAGRASTTPALLALCERRLGLAGSHP